MNTGVSALLAISCNMRSVVACACLLSCALFGCSRSEITYPTIPVKAYYRDLSRVQQPEA